MQSLGTNSIKVKQMGTFVLGKVLELAVEKSKYLRALVVDYGTSLLIPEHRHGVLACQHRHFSAMSNRERQGPNTGLLNGGTSHFYNLSRGTCLGRHGNSSCASFPLQLLYLIYV